LPAFVQFASTLPDQMRVAPNTAGEIETTARKIAIRRCILIGPRRALPHCDRRDQDVAVSACPQWTAFTNTPPPFITNATFSIAAMSLAVAVFVAVRVGVEKLARPHYLAPRHRTVDSLAPSAGARDWVLENRLVDAVGRQISTAREDLAIVHAQHARVDPQDYLLSLGWRRAITYQPNDRFWTFQVIEMSVFVALGVLAIAATLALAQRATA